MKGFMSYRNGTYVAFNGCNTTDPTQSDIRYYRILEAWHENPKMEFAFINSHEKTYAVKDSSTEETLKRRLKDRLEDSKNLLLICTENTSDNRGMLPWEIDQAINVYKLPIIVAYADTILSPDTLIIKDSGAYKGYWPEILTKLYDEGKVNLREIHFKKEEIEVACKEHSVHNYIHIVDR